MHEVFPSTQILPKQGRCPETLTGTALCGTNSSVSSVVIDFHRRNIGHACNATEDDMEYVDPITEEYGEACKENAEEFHSRITG